MRNEIKRAKSQRKAILNWRRKNPEAQKLINWGVGMRTKGYHTIYAPVEVANKLKAKGCHFCGRPWNWIDTSNKRKKDIVAEDIIVTCDQCHKIYIAFDKEVDMFDYIVNLAKKWIP
jgi:hypothetical protein